MGAPYGCSERKPCTEVTENLGPGFCIVVFSSLGGGFPWVVKMSGNLVSADIVGILMLLEVGTLGYPEPPTITWAGLSDVGLVTTTR